ncbi:MAG: ADP-ribosylglycohydrolase [Firmicutes bacterium]|jgi:ADP-ribosylglycohydrolase|nr:ADP-ribosylglycohydrolase [Bacillota bacterium]
MRIKDAIVGLCVADALGVPVEFCNREALKDNPVVGMRAYGTFNQPAGTWSDDTSMTLCLIDSLQNGLNYTDIMDKFLKWMTEGAYTPYGEAFGIGRTTRAAIARYAGGTPPLACGGTAESDNGNGSLMRTLPLLFYLHTVYGPDFVFNEEAMGIIHNVSALTHAHKRSQIACGIYLSIAEELWRKRSTADAFTEGTDRAFAYYKKHDEFAVDLAFYHRLIRKDFVKLPEKEIKSNGYVVHSLEAALWCLLNTDSYRNCVLLAVNLGDDTDTVAALAGGLAGLCYGYGSIPKEWLRVIVNLDYIENLCRQYEDALSSGRFLLRRRQ